MNLQNRTMDGRPLKACHYNGLTYLIFSDDWPARNYPPQWLFDRLTDAPPVGACADFSGEEFNLIRKLFAISPNAALADVGSNYGREAIRYALFRRALGLAPKEHAVLAFEPGPVRHVAAVNIELHGVSEVTLLPCAVADVAAASAFWTLPDNSLGSAMNISRHPDAVPVETTSVRLSDVLAETGADGPLFAKVDTQGYEPMVWAGLADYIADHPVSGIFEFSPRLMKKAGDPLEFLLALFGRAIIIDIGAKRDRSVRVERKDAKDFVAALSAEQPDYTDLLIIDMRVL